MNNDIKIGSDLNVGVGFVPPEFLGPGEDEYRIRNEQFLAMGKDPGRYRKLKPFELETLVRQNNTSSDWSQILVAEPFTPELVYNTSFSGLVRIGHLEEVTLEHHDLHLIAGISNSQIIACDIGDNCVISNCAYIAHYIIDDNCILIDNAEVHVSNHSKFGNGNIIEGEGEELRITIDVMNEGGGRWVYPFAEMTCADAYLWARHRDRAELMKQFGRMTDALFDNRRGRYGIIGRGSVLKSNGVVKDVAIGESAYIKGANKLKNITIKSREDARTQIGEGVELVNGIVGYGCKIFYGCKAVRFVMCDSSSLKYGARLIHSILGENSTVSCCEILNNLIFPAHEQHHNTSFLIASLVKGQSNMAAGATIGSNHNSRAPDGEIEAGRGFWPGLCTSVKHSSRFASFCLLAKGDYRFELDITLPFCLVDNDYKRDSLILAPAYWWMSNKYALMRNEGKFRSRDARFDKSLGIEYSPFAPDTAEEILAAMALLDEATDGLCGGKDGGNLPLEAEIHDVEHSSRKCFVKKPVQAWRAYREMLLWFAGREIAHFAIENPKIAKNGTLPTWEELSASLVPDENCRVGTQWENLGGLLVPVPRLEKILEKAEVGGYATWKEFHAEYIGFTETYPMDKVRYAWSLLGRLYPRASRMDGKAAILEGPSKEGLGAAFTDLKALGVSVADGVFESRAKDWSNRFRKATYRSEAEMLAVLGKPEENSFVKKTRQEAGSLGRDLERLKAAL